MAGENRKLNIGPILVFLSGVCFSLGGLFLKYIPWSPLAINAARNAVAFIFVFLYLKIIGHKIIFNRTVLIGALAISVTQIGTVNWSMIAFPAVVSLLAMQ